MPSIKALLPFIAAVSWAWSWEFVRSLLYEKGLHILSPYSDQILQWGPPALFVLFGCYLIWITRPPERTKTVTVRNAFSQTQSIKDLPTSLGGNHTLKLDNVATLRLRAQYSMKSVTLMLDTVPMDISVQHSPGVEVQDAKTYSHAATTPYSFDVDQNKRQEITVADRTFIVTLLGVKANPIEYVFGVSDK